VKGAVRIAALVLGGLGLAGGIAGFAAAAGQELVAGEGVRVGAFMHLNSLGAITSVALGVVALAGAAAGRRVVVLLASSGWLAAGVLTVLQAGREPNWLGGTAATLSFFLGVGAGLLALAMAPDAAGTNRVDR